MSKNFNYFFLKYMNFRIRMKYAKYFFVKLETSDRKDNDFLSDNARRDPETCYIFHFPRRPSLSHIHILRVNPEKKNTHSFLLPLPHPKRTRWMRRASCHGQMCRPSLCAVERVGRGQGVCDLRPSTDVHCATYQ
jgi:hypothetical protein